MGQLITTAELSLGLAVATPAVEMHEAPISLDGSGEGHDLRNRALSILLGTACPGACSGVSPFRGLWAEEAANRAAALFQLFQRMEVRSWERAVSLGTPTPQILHAVELANHYEALDLVAHENVLVPCGESLRGVVRGLVDLFGPAFGDIAVTMRIDHLALAAFERRAVVLAASEIVADALLRGFAGRVDGCLAASLRIGASSNAILSFEHDGRGTGVDRPDASHSLLCKLVAVLGGDVCHYRSPRGWAGTEIQFPLRHSTLVA